MKYGIKTRKKLNEGCPGDPLGTQIYMTFSETTNGKGNRYLKRQYKRLIQLRANKAISTYWKLSWTLMSRSWPFLIASLGSWKSTWYKELSLVELKRTFSSLNKILTFRILQANISNVWIESPANKWRQLCIPNKGWRLYLHMLTIFITYIYEPELDPQVYEGFIHGRGCKSWWEHVIWSPLLDQEHIVEVDLSSGFPNVNKEILQKALTQDGLVPKSWINLILQHLNSPQTEAKFFPTLTSYIENKYNRHWRQGNRSVPMGLGISPILFVITQRWVWKQLNLPSQGFYQKWYADDCGLYFTSQGFLRVMKHLGKDWFWFIDELLQFNNPLLSLFNEHPLFQHAGIKFCKTKSRIVKMFGYWLRPHNSLGLQIKPRAPWWIQLTDWLEGEEPILDLSGHTRGRAANPAKRKASTPPSRQELNYKRVNSNQQELNHLKEEANLDYSTLKQKYKHYFGLLMGKLYSTRPAKPPGPRKLKASHPHSLLGKLLKGSHSKNQNLKKMGLILDVYNAGSKMTELLLRSQLGLDIDERYVKCYPNIIRELTWIWPKPNQRPEDLNLENPLRTDLNPNDGYFIKYSELGLDEDQLQILTKEYEQSKP